jgi:hypothetical protein
MMLFFGVKFSHNYLSKLPVGCVTNSRFADQKLIFPFVNAFFSVSSEASLLDGQTHSFVPVMWSNFASHLLVVPTSQSQIAGSFASLPVPSSG